MLDLVIDALKAQSDFTEDQKHKVKELDEATIISTALVILVAGYDTTAQTLAWACYRFILAISTFDIIFASCLLSGLQRIQMFKRNSRLRWTLPLMKIMVICQVMPRFKI